MADTEVARAVVTIVPTMEGAQSTITKELTGAASSSGVSEAGKEAGSVFSSGLAKGLAAATAVTAAVTALAVKATQAFVNSASQVAEYGDNIDKMSQKMGISAEAYQEWDFVMQHCGTSMDSLKSSMKTLATAAESGSEAFEKLGLSQEEIAGMSQEELFSATISALQNVEDTTQRAYLASQLLGKGATELGALLNMSAEETEAMKDQLHDLGGVMSDDSVKAAAGFQDALLNMQTAADGLKNNMMVNFLPGMSSVMNGLASVFSGDSEGMTEIRSGIESILTSAQEVLPGFFEMGSEIIMSLIKGLEPMLPDLLTTIAEMFAELINVLVEALPELIPVVIDAVGIIVGALFDNLPTLITTVFELFTDLVNKLTDPSCIDQLVDMTVTLIETIANGLITALPILVPAVVKIIVQLTTSLLQRIPDLIAAAGKLVAGIVTGLVKCLPDIAKGALQIVSELLGTLAQIPKKLIEMALGWGKDLISNFTKGITDTVGKVKDAVGGVANKIKGFLGFSEPEEGPLSDFHTYAPDMIELFSEGLKQSKAKLSGTLTSVLQLPDSTVPEMASADGGGITIPIYIGDDLLDTVIVNANQRINLRSGGVA